MKKIAQHVFDLDPHKKNTRVDVQQNDAENIIKNAPGLKTRPGSI